MQINDKGQCPNCLVKPLTYQRPFRLFCSRCCREFKGATGEQTDNWAWKRDGEQFIPTYKTSDYHTATPTAAALRRAAMTSGERTK